MGRWVECADHWYDPQARFCALTGRLLPGRAWVAEVDGRPLTFSDPESEHLYREYILGQGGTVRRAAGDGPAPKGG